MKQQTDRQTKKEERNVKSMGKEWVDREICSGKREERERGYFSAVIH